LRVLLAQQGIPGDNVDAFVQSNPPLSGSVEGYGSATSGAVTALEQLLITRRDCCSSRSGTGSASGSPPRILMNHSGISDGAGSTGSSEGTIQSSWETNNQSKHSQRSHNVTPTPTTSTVNGLGYSQCSNSIRNSNFDIPTQSQRISMRMRNQNLNWLSDSPVSSNIFDSDPPYISQSSNITSYDQQAQAHQQPSLAYNIPHSSSANVSSCVYATDMITTMAGGDPSAVGADLGCLPGMDCEVDNQLVFNVMDRYNVGL